MSHLHAAAITGNLLSVQVLLDDNVDVNSKHRSGETALHSAASEGHIEIIEELLDAGVDIDAQNWNGQTALHLSALKGHSQATEFLACAGADWTIKTKYSQMTALHLATYNGHLAVVQTLLQHQQDTAKDHVGKMAEFYSPSIDIKREFERIKLTNGDRHLRDDGTLARQGNGQLDPKMTETSTLGTSPEDISSSTDTGRHNNTTNAFFDLFKADTTNGKETAHLPQHSLENGNSTKYSRNKNKQRKTATENQTNSKHGSRKNENYTTSKNSVTSTPKIIKLKDTEEISDLKLLAKNSKVDKYGKDELQFLSISKSHETYTKKTKTKLASSPVDRKFENSTKFKARLKHDVFARLVKK